VRDATVDPCRRAGDRGSAQVPAAAADDRTATVDTDVARVTAITADQGDRRMSLRNHDTAGPPGATAGARAAAAPRTLRVA